MDSRATDMEKLRSFLTTQTQESVFLHCLGRKRMQNAPALADDIVVVAIDTEWWTRDPTKLTEVGIATFDSRDMHGIDPGPFGENLLKNVWFYHLRNIPNAHLLNLKYAKGDPRSNRFGRTAFVTPEEMNTALKACFVDIDRPIVFMGHAIDNDFSKLDETLGFDAYGTGSVVFTIDTQDLARETGHWTHPHNKIGLRTLVEEVAGFEYRDIHTACNDIAMTLISAIQLVCRNAASNNGRTLQEVVDGIETYSQDVSISWGTGRFCLRCGARNHFEEYCKATNIKCRHCMDAKRFGRAKTHRTESCISFALDNMESLRSKRF